MRINASRQLQVFYRRDGEPVEVYPGFSFDETMITSPGAPCLREPPPLLQQLKRKPDSSICFLRTFALGDILILTPIFNSLRKEYPDCKIIFCTASGFVNLFKYWDEVSTVSKTRLIFGNYDVGFSLDGVVEKDHRGDSYSYMHRLDIYCEFMNYPVPPDPIFSLPYGEQEREWAEGIIGKLKVSDKPIAIMQISGAMWFNSFRPEKMINIATGLSDACSVILVHNSRLSVEVPNVLNLSGKTTHHQLVALIDCADVAITMDSGTLWVAHCTKTPVIAMFGHTRAIEKMKYHRNYYAINLAEMVGCKSCFGRQSTCEGRGDCLNRSDEKQIIKEIKDGVTKLVS